MKKPIDPNLGDSFDSELLATDSDGILKGEKSADVKKDTFESAYSSVIP